MTTGESNINPDLLPVERRIIIATDASDVTRLGIYARRYAPLVGAVGLKPEIEMDSSNRYKQAADIVRANGATLFLDAQLSRAPYDVGRGADRLFKHYRTHAISVSSSVGERGFLEAAKARDAINDALAKHSADLPKRKVYAASVSPDYSSEECFELYGCSPQDYAERVSTWAVHAGLDGVICGYSQIAAVFEVRDRLRMQELFIIASGVRREEDIVGGKDAIGTKRDVNTSKNMVLEGADGLLVGISLLSKNVQNKDSAYVEIVQGMQEADKILADA